MEIGILRARTLVALATVALVGVGCASAGGAVEGDPSGESVTVLVENHNWQDATVYVTGYGPRARLGTVTSMTSKRFVVPRALQGTDGLRLEADLIGSSTRRGTGRILVSPGDEVRWTLENQLALSSYAVR